MAEISLSHQIRCVKRELNMRHRVYPRQVAEGRLEQWQADNEIAAMTAVLATLEKLNDGGQKYLLEGL